MYELMLLQEIERPVYLSDILLVLAMLAVGFILTVLILRWRLSVPASSAPKFYRYDLKIRHCPYCEQPIAGLGDKICANCGYSLEIESMHM